MRSSLPLQITNHVVARLLRAAQGSGRWHEHQVLQLPRIRTYGQLIADHTTAWLMYSPVNARRPKAAPVRVP